MSENRELAFRVRLRMTGGNLKLGGQPVGAVSGQVTVPLQAFYRPRPALGAYGFMMPRRGQLVPRTTEPHTVIIETMGYLDVAAVIAQLQIPDGWVMIPAELLSRIELDADLEFLDVDADEEYKLNEPADLVQAEDLYKGLWHLTIKIDLEQSVRRDEPRLDLDRWECEADARYATFTERP